MNFRKAPCYCAWPIISGTASITPPSSPSLAPVPINQSPAIRSGALDGPWGWGAGALRPSGIIIRVVESRSVDCL